MSSSLGGWTYVGCSAGDTTGFRDSACARGDGTGPPVSWSAIRLSCVSMAARAVTIRSASLGLGVGIGGGDDWLIARAYDRSPVGLHLWRPRLGRQPAEQRVKTPVRHDGR